MNQATRDATVNPATIGTARMRGVFKSPPRRLDRNDVGSMVDAETDREDSEDAADDSVTAAVANVAVVAWRSAKEEAAATAAAGGGRADRRVETAKGEGEDRLPLLRGSTTKADVVVVVRPRREIATTRAAAARAEGLRKATILNRIPSSFLLNSKKLR